MKKLLVRLLKSYYQDYRVRFYTALSDKTTMSGYFIRNQPVLIKGTGKIEVGENVIIGVYNSPFFFNSNAYFEVRNIDAFIKIGNHVIINNNFSLICDRSIIEIGNHVLIGFNVTIVDSDFHPINPCNRLGTEYECKPVLIGNNVFIGSDVKILKGVTIGDNSVVAAGTVVTKSFGPNVVIGGNPAKQISEII